MISTLANHSTTHAANATTKTYRIFGFNLASNFTFTHTLTLTTGQPDLLFLIVNEKPVEQIWEQTSPVFPGVNEPDLGVHFYPQAGFDVLHFPGSGDFYIWSDKVLCHPTGPVDATQLEIDFLGTVFSFWLERQGLLALHASAVVIPQGGAVAFLATSQGGKSSLAAAFLHQGYGLLTDDILPVDWAEDALTGRPGYAQMRLWPDQANYFLGRHEDLERVHPAVTKRRLPLLPEGWGNFCDHPQPLTCLYLPERRDPEAWGPGIDIVPVPQPEAVIELIRQSFAAPILQAMGILPERLMKVSQLVQRVSVRRLIYPNGMAYLPEVCRAIEADCQPPLSV